MLVAIIYMIDGSVKRKLITWALNFRVLALLKGPVKNGQRIKQSTSGEASTEGKNALTTR